MFLLFSVCFKTVSFSKSLTLKIPFSTIVVFVAGVDQDQAAQNVQPGLWSTLATLGKNCVRKSSIDSLIIQVKFLWQ